MRKLVAPLAVVGGLIGAGAAPVSAQQPSVIALPAAACNQGTANAHGNVAGPAHLHVRNHGVLHDDAGVPSLGREPAQEGRRRVPLRSPSFGPRYLGLFSR